MLLYTTMLCHHESYFVLFVLLLQTRRLSKHIWPKSPWHLAWDVRSCSKSYPCMCPPKFSTLWSGCFYIEWCNPHFCNERLIFTIEYAWIFVYGLVGGYAGLPVCKLSKTFCHAQVSSFYCSTPFACICSVTAPTTTVSLLQENACHVASLHKYIHGEIHGDLDRSQCSKQCSRWPNIPGEMTIRSIMIAALWLIVCFTSFAHACHIFLQTQIHVTSASCLSLVSFPALCKLLVLPQILCIFTCNAWLGMECKMASWSVAPTQNVGSRRKLSKRWVMSHGVLGILSTGVV